MTDSITSTFAALSLRTAGRERLADALQATRQRTLALATAWAQALPDLKVPLAAEFNPPIWELGHVGWFQDAWIARNPERVRGTACSPEPARLPARRRDADALYDSSRVPHESRWQLPFPTLEATCSDLDAGLADTLTLLSNTAEDDTALYFYRLVLFHEEMHNEASVYMAQALDVPLPAVLTGADDRQRAAPPAAGRLHVSATDWTLGTHAGGFAFDNELRAHRVALAPFEIDSRAVSWSRYLEFVEATGHPLPRHVRAADDAWQRRRFGTWELLPLDAAVVHVSCADAGRWCDWAGRRLPTEAEWECAALTQPGFAWGEVWEWTASPFEPYPGFAPHPYSDYSRPWFGSRRVLRGASHATSPHMVDARYRNFFTPERADILCGFRSCAR